MPPAPFNSEKKDDGLETFRDDHHPPEKGLSRLFHAIDDFVDDEVELLKKSSRAFRRAWVPVIKSILGSAADLIGDWVFYIRTRNGAEGLGRFEAPLFFFNIVASIMGALAITVLFMNNCPCFKRPDESHGTFKERCMNRMNWVLGLEMFLEDIPQMALVTAVLVEKRGGWNGTAVFNFTTSVFNFTFNALDILMPLDEEHHHEARKEKHNKQIFDEKKYDTGNPPQGDSAEVSHPQETYTDSGDFNSA